MKKTVKYTDPEKDIQESLKRAVVVPDTLPPPSELIFKEPKKRITIELNKSSIDFFKDQAQKNEAKYQTMINEVLHRYVLSQNQMFGR